MSNHLKAAIALNILVLAFSQSSVQATQTFTTALSTYTKQHEQKVVFSAQSGNYGIALTTMNGEEGPMQVYQLTASCACWKITANAGGVVSDATDLQSLFGIDAHDAAVLSPKIKAYNASVK
jgi:hypothetical protein